MAVLMGTIGRPSSGNAVVDYFLSRPKVAAPISAAKKTSAPVVRAPSAPAIAPKTLTVRPVVPASVPRTTPKVVIAPAMEKSSASFPSASSSSPSSSSSSSSFMTSSDAQVIEVPGFAVRADAPSSSEDVERGVPMFRAEAETEAAPVASSSVVRASSQPSKVPTWVYAAGGAIVIGAIGFAALKRFQ